MENRENRFWSRVLRPDALSCWNWDKPGPYGYGVTGRPGGTIGAHRRAYELVYGDLPSDMVVDHLCRNRACCNPLHLEAVTQSENVLRGSHHQRLKTHCPRGHAYDRPSIPGKTRKCHGCVAYFNSKRRRS